MDGYIEGALKINRVNSAAMDGAMFEAVYREHYGSVYNYVSFRINNHYDAEDLACQTFENAVRRFATYRPETAPMEAWLIGIAKNVVTDYFRRSKRRDSSPLDKAFGLVSFEPQPDETVVRKEENRALIRAMAKLNDKERNVLSMKFATDLKNVQIAKVMGVSESSVGVTVHRAVKKLKRLMEREGGANE